MFPTTKKDVEVYNAGDSCDAAEKAGRKLREVIDSATDEARDVTAAVVKRVNEKPVQSTAIAAGIGVLIGLLLRRR